MMSCVLRTVFRMKERCKPQFKTERQIRALHGSGSKSKETELVKQLKAKIKLSGPITVAEYMQEVLSNPLAGYYMSKDVFGVQGDFITSPEISQMFGELLGIWFYERWLNCGSPQDFQLVELGPGRGTLISDILRVFAKLGKISDNLNLHLVEISPAMREMQKRLLCDGHKTQEMTAVTEGDTLLTKDGIPVTWHGSIFNVPKGLTFYLAHEFFDALPVHQFQKTKKGWREVMVDIEQDNAGPHHLRFCLAPSPTPATVLIPEEIKGDDLEIRPEAQVIAESMAGNIRNFGGCSLIVDYGDVTCNRHTLRAFQNHKLTNPLSEPGHSDLTSNVDFSQLEKVLNQNGVMTFGPVTQRNFLKTMGIDVRKEVLLKKATVYQAKSIETAYRMLTNDSEMGNCFKFFTATHGNATPPGF